MERSSEHLAAIESTEIGKRRWVRPEIAVIGMDETAGDPTISDDGLGDGLFS